MNKIKITLFLVLIGLAALACWLGYPHFTAKQTPENLTRITLAYRPGVAVDLAILAAVSDGRMQAEGFDVQLRPYGRADLIFAALKSGEIQGSLGVPLEPLLDQAASGNFPAKAYLVWYFDSKTGYDGFVTLANGVQSVAELSGKTVASHPSKQVTYFVQQMAPGASVKPYNPATPLASLDAGDVSAIYVLEPFLSIAASNPKFRILEKNSISNRLFSGQRIPAAVSILSSSWAEQHPAEADRFVTAAQNIFTAFDAKQLLSARLVLQKPDFGSLPASIAASVAEPAASLPASLEIGELENFTSTLKAGGLIKGDRLDFDALFYKSANSK